MGVGGASSQSLTTLCKGPNKNQLPIDLGEFEKGLQRNVNHPYVQRFSWWGSLNVKYFFWKPEKIAPDANKDVVKT